MALSRKLSKSANSKLPPGRLRGSQAWSAFVEGQRQTPKKDLPPLPETRRMQDSYVEMDLRFSESADLRNTYIGAHTSVRMGRLMEDLDSLAGASSYRHVLPDGASPSDAHAYGLYLVTASVSRVDLLRPIKDPITGKVPDLRLSGHVSYASSSSLEVFVRLSTLSERDDGGETILLGRFAMACRSYSGGKHPIAKLEIHGKEEEELFAMGKEMREEKKLRSQSSLEKSPPNEVEAKRMHDIFIGKADLYERNAVVPPEVVFMKDTALSSVVLQHPQESNVHGKVFGGYLMRLAYETAYSTACLFAKSPVQFLALDEIRFASPVEIGTLLNLSSRVTFAPLKGEHFSFHVAVEASTTDLYTGERKITNTFNYTFAKQEPLRRYVLPRSYKEAMAWLDAQRRREQGIALRKAYGV